MAPRSVLGPFVWRGVEDRIRGQHGDRADAEQALYVDERAPLSSVLCRQLDREVVTHGTGQTCYLCG